MSVLPCEIVARDSGQLSHWQVVGYLNVQGEKGLTAISSAAIFVKTLPRFCSQLRSCGRDSPSQKRGAGCQCGHLCIPASPTARDTGTERGAGETRKPCAMPLHLPVDGPQDDETAGWYVGIRLNVRGSFCFWCCLTDFDFCQRPDSFVAGLKLSMSTASLLASTGHFGSKSFSLSNFPPGLESQTRVPTFGSLRGGASCSRSCFCSGISSMPSPPHGTSPGSQSCSHFYPRSGPLTLAL